MLDLARVFEYLTSCRWFRRIRANGRLDLGGYDYYLGTSLSQSSALASASMPIKAASWGNQQAVRAPSRLHSRG